jgi:hypothetical protein
MGKRRWTTPEQRAWLEALVAEFVQAQQMKATGSFFDDTYSRWYEKWPTAAPSDEEIKKAEGSAEKALASKRKAVDSVSIYTVDPQWCKFYLLVPAHKILVS